MQCIALFHYVASLGFIAGEVLGFIAVVLLNPGYIRKLRAHNHIPVHEWLLPLVVAGAISFGQGKDGGSRKGLITVQNRYGR